MVNVIIDNQPVSVPEGATILEASRKTDIRIPTLCHLDLSRFKMVNQVASCRMCVVEVEGRRNLAPSCATPVSEGMKISTNSKRVLAARRKLLQLMLSNHPADCLVCSKSTDCELQKLVWNSASTRRRINSASAIHSRLTNRAARSSATPTSASCAAAARRCATRCRRSAR